MTRPPPRSERPREIVFVMTGAFGTTGGIASLNRNIILALLELAQERKTSLKVISYLEDAQAKPAFLPNWVSFQSLGKNKLALVTSLNVAACARPLFIFDHVTLALPVLPAAAVGWVKTVLFAHGSEAWRRVRRTSRWSFRSAALTLANSEYTLRKMRLLMPLVNGVACPLGLSPEFPLCQKIPPPSAARVEMQAADGNCYPLGARVLLLVGRMLASEREKGHAALIKILPALRSEFPDVQLVFPGPGDDQPHLAQLARKVGVASAVFMPGYLPSETLQKLYAQCFAFVMPSRQEGFGLVYLEAMNCGKPCVGCLNDGAADVIVQGETGLLLHDRDDSQELLGALQLLLRNPDMAERLGRQGFVRLHEHFTARRLQDRLKHYIGRIL